MTRAGMTDQALGQTNYDKALWYLRSQICYGRSIAKYKLRMRAEEYTALTSMQRVDDKRVNIKIGKITDYEFKTKRSEDEHRCPSSPRTLIQNLRCSTYPIARSCWLTSATKSPAVAPSAPGTSAMAGS